MSIFLKKPDCLYLFSCTNAAKLRYILKTFPFLFIAEDEDEDEWPPFKRMGCFDPYSDDPRYDHQSQSMEHSIVNPFKGSFSLSQSPFIGRD